LKQQVEEVMGMLYLGKTSQTQAVEPVVLDQSSGLFLGQEMSNIDQEILPHSRKGRKSWFVFFDVCFVLTLQMCNQVE
jgi:hypothetical protein